MALLSGTSILRLLSLLRLGVAYLLLFQPTTLTTLPTILLLSDALRLPDPSTSSLSVPSASTALTALVLSYTALADLVTSTLPGPTRIAHFSAQVPLRLALLFGFTGWVYLTRPGEGLLADTLVAGKSVPALGCARDGFVFAVAFAEMCGLFWAWSALGEEKREVVLEMIAERERMVEEVRKGL